MYENIPPNMDKKYTIHDNSQLDNEKNPSPRLILAHLLSIKVAHALTHILTHGKLVICYPGPITKREREREKHISKQANRKFGRYDRKTISLNILLPIIV